MLLGDYHFYKNQLVWVVIQIYENQIDVFLKIELEEIGQLLNNLEYLIFFLTFKQFANIMIFTNAITNNFHNWFSHLGYQICILLIHILTISIQNQIF
jgi:hypothetical protein